MLDIDSARNLIGCQIITETALPLGWVIDIKRNLQNDNISSLIIAFVNLPLAFDRSINTYMKWKKRFFSIEYA